MTNLIALLIINDFIYIQAISSGEVHWKCDGQSVGPWISDLWFSPKYHLKRKLFCVNCFTPDYLTPWHLSECDEKIDFYQKKFTGLIDNQLKHKNQCVTHFMFKTKKDPDYLWYQKKTIKQNRVCLIHLLAKFGLLLAILHLDICRELANCLWKGVRHVCACPTAFLASD